MNNLFHGESALGAQALFAQEQLPFPPIPASLSARLAQREACVYATRALAESPYDLDAFVAEVEGNPAVKEYAVVGFDGHGINSWAAHYYLVSDGLALFIQQPWGGAYLDADEARASIRDWLEWAAAIQARVAGARQAGKVPPSWRLLIVATGFGHSGWRWLVPGKARGTDTDWNPASGMRETLTGVLDAIATGQGDDHGS